VSMNLCDFATGALVSSGNFAAPVASLCAIFFWILQTPPGQNVSAMLRHNLKPWDAYNLPVFKQMHCVFAGLLQLCALPTH
jgi:hypothetical protein